MIRRLYKNATIIDGSGNDPIQNGSIITKDDIIEKIGLFDYTDENIDEQIDLSDKFIMPGIIDAHVHSMLDETPHCLQSIAKRTDAENTIIVINNLKKLLSDGVVFFREMGGMNHIDVSISNAVSRGEVIGPDFLPWR